MKTNARRRVFGASAHDRRCDSESVLRCPAFLPTQFSLLIWVVRLLTSAATTMGYGRNHFRKLAIVSRAAVAASGWGSTSAET